MNESKKDSIIYLDNAATTKTDKESAELALHMMCDLYANPSSAHSLGFEAEKCINTAKQQILQALGYKNTQATLVFTSGGTEADNMAILGTAKTLCRRGKKIVISDAEHPAVENTVRELEKNGFSVCRISTKNGELDLEYAKSVLSDDTILVSCMAVNNETGAIFDISSLCTLTRKLAPNAYFHTDAVQGFTKMQKLSCIGADLISISGHKIHAPKGVGALLIRKGVRISPLIFGGNQQEALRSGTEAVGAICAFGLSAEKATRDFEKDYEYIKDLNMYLRQKLENCSDVVINTRQEGHTPYILSLSVVGIRSEIMLRFLGERGIFVSAGSACSSKSSDNRVLSAYGIERSLADSTLRISFSKYNTKQELDKFVLTLNEGIRTLISLKPRKHI